MKLTSLDQCCDKIPEAGLIEVNLFTEAEDIQTIKHDLNNKISKFNQIHYLVSNDRMETMKCLFACNPQMEKNPITKDTEIHSVTVSF